MPDRPNSESPDFRLLNRFCHELRQADEVVSGKSKGIFDWLRHRYKPCIHAARIGSLQ